MISVYIASSLKHRLVAEHVAAWLETVGDKWPTQYEIVSTWHKNARSTVAVEKTLTLMEQTEIACDCAGEVRKADALIWIYGNNDGRCGAAIECGIAIALGRDRRLAPLSTPFKLKGPTSMEIYACPAPGATRSELPIMLYSAEAWTHFDSIDVMLEELSRL
jgi:hypothetical protein